MNLAADDLTELNYSAKRWNFILALNLELALKYSSL